MTRNESAGDALWFNTVKSNWLKDLSQPR